MGRWAYPDEAHRFASLRAVGVGGLRRRCEPTIVATTMLQQNSSLSNGTALRRNFAPLWSGPRCFGRAQPAGSLPGWAFLSVEATRAARGAEL